jgi:archaetidylinositol phosphate synthase
MGQVLTRLKERIQAALTGEAELLHRAGLTPNRVSGLGILLAFLAGCFYWEWQAGRFFLVIAPILFLLSGFCDALDGVIARLYGETTVFGGFLDSLLDRYADAFVFVALIVSGLCDVFWGSAALVGSLLVSYARSRAEAAGIKMETVGLAERAERMVILAAASFVAFFWLEALGWGVMILAVLTNLTVLQRAFYFYKATKQKKG